MLGMYKDIQKLIRKLFIGKVTAVVLNTVENDDIKHAFSILERLKSLTIFLPSETTISADVGHCLVPSSSPTLDSEIVSRAMKILLCKRTFESALVKIQGYWLAKLPSKKEAFVEFLKTEDKSEIENHNTMLFTEKALKRRRILVLLSTTEILAFLYSPQTTWHV